MLVTLLGISMEVKPEQFLKAPLPMLVTLLGMVTEVKPEQFPKAELKKAEGDIEIVPSLISTVVPEGIVPLYL